MSKPIRGAIRKGDWKLVKMATFPGKTELFDLAEDPGERTNVADQHPEIVADLEARLLGYARQQKPAEWIKAQPAFVGAQGKTVLDPDFDIDDSGLSSRRSFYQHADTRPSNVVSDARPRIASVASPTRALTG